MCNLCHLYLQSSVLYLIIPRCSVRKLSEEWSTLKLMLQSHKFSSTNHIVCILCSSLTMLAKGCDATIYTALHSQQFRKLEIKFRHFLFHLTAFSLCPILLRGDDLSKPGRIPRLTRITLGSLIRKYKQTLHCFYKF